MTIILSQDIHTPDQLSMCIQELRSFAAKRRNAVIKARVGGTSDGAVIASGPVASLLRGNSILDPTAKELEDFIKALEALRLNAPVIHLTLAALPGPQLSAKLVEWFRREIHQHTLLTFVMNRTIGGGVVVRTGSHIYDASFTSQLLRHKDRLTEIASRV